MTLHLIAVGIDVSKAHLDIATADDGRAERVANASEPVAALAARLAGEQAFVLFEATGRYDQCLREALAAAGVAFARVNPSRARAFAKATGVLAKTDEVDARMLARMAAVLRPRPDAPADPDRERLAALHRRRDQLVGDRAQERCRAEQAAPDQAASIARHIAWLDAEIAALEAAIRDQLAASDRLADAAALLRTAPGVGPVTAATLLALLPELGSRSAKTIAALAGLAPVNHDSGALRGQRHIGQGRRRVRQALYMAALSALRAQARFADIYHRLRSKGRPAKVAIIAVARKLLVALNAMLASQTPYRA